MSTQVLIPPERAKELRPDDRAAFDREGVVADWRAIGIRDPEDRSPAYRASTLDLVEVCRIQRAVFEQAPDDDDYCEPLERIEWWRVRALGGAAMPDAEAIQSAFHWTLSSQGHCGHEHDCCGCRFFTMSLAYRLPAAAERRFAAAEGEQLWVTHTASARNY